MRVDRTALKVNQAFIVGLNLLAFLLTEDRGGQWIVLFVGLVLAAGSLFRGAAVFKQFYFRVLRPAGILKPNVRAEDPVPHEFAQALGGTFLLAGFAALVLGAVVVGWVLAWIVIALAFINLTINFCAGCFLYFRLGRFGLLPRTRGEHA